MQQRKKVGRKRLQLKGDYKEFSDFYTENKIVIFRTLVSLFEKFKDETKQEISLTIKANIKGFDWDTELRFKREEIPVLMKDVMPYFEEQEDYEMCGEIKTLYKELIT